MGFLLLMFIGWLIVVSLATIGFVWSLRRPRRKTYAVALGRGDAVDPGDLGLAGEAVRFDLGDGGMTDGWVLEGDGEDDGKGGLTVVMVHGYGDSKYGLLGWAKKVCELKVAKRVVVYDQRGQGESEGKTCDLGVNEPGDVLKVVNQLGVEECGDVLLYGCSMGGGTAIKAGVLMSESEEAARLVGVIVDGPYRLWDEPVRNVMKLKKYPRWPMVEVGGWLLNMQLKGGLFEIDRVTEAKRLKCPLLVLHGTGDRVCSFESGKQIAEAAVDGELIKFEGVGHLELAEADPERYAQGLKQFFVRIRGTS
ncbi:alpha/beta fold hydrolase [Planctomycetota bacterium]|nr:alpha/beta fold hydrolase [Planctomycetota bacterium]